jgi:hypothetical protein
VRTIRVPDCRLNARSRFDVSEDGDFLCAGNSAGVVFIYDLHEGTLISKLQSGRSKHPANGCVFSRNCQCVCCLSLSSLARAPLAGSDRSCAVCVCGVCVRVRCRHVALVCAEPFIYRWSMPDETEEETTAAAAAANNNNKSAVLPEDEKEDDDAPKENGGGEEGL